MLAEFRFLNLYTYYKVSGKMTKDFARHPCFANAFIFNRDQDKSEKYKNTYSIHVYTDTYKNSSKSNNFCFVDIEKYLTYFQRVMPFEFTLETMDHGVIMHITVDNYRYIHNYILCCVRYLYEQPYNLALSDAIQLYESGECPGLNIIDCFNLTLGTSQCRYSGEQVCMFAHTPVKPMGTKELINMLRYYERNNNTCVSVNTDFIERVTYMEHGHIENHINTFYRRLPVYKSNYENYLKKYV